MNRASTAWINMGDEYLDVQIVDESTADDESDGTVVAEFRVTPEAGGEIGRDLCGIAGLLALLAQEIAGRTEAVR